MLYIQKEKEEVEIKQRETGKSIKRRKKEQEILSIRIIHKTSSFWCKIFPKKIYVNAMAINAKEG